jgi:hypothetical protein
LIDIDFKRDLSAIHRMLKTHGLNPNEQLVMTFHDRRLVRIRYKSGYLQGFFIHLPQ